ncbi:MAG: LapA family protein [Nitrospirota bacterium]|nr:LapA family protein [Nitrospirota bacterium]
MIRLFLISVISVIFFGALYLNQEQQASLHFFWGMETKLLPIHLIALGSFLIGLLFSVLLFVPGWVRSMLDRRKKSKRIEALEIDIDKMRSETLKESTPVFTPTEIEKKTDDFS